MYFRYGRIRNGGNPNEALCKTCPPCGEESLSAIRSSTGSKTLSEWLIPVVSLLSRELSANGLFTMFISRSSPVLGPPSGTLAAGRLTSEAPSVPLAVIFLSLVSTDWLHVSVRRDLISPFLSIFYNRFKGWRWALHLAHGFVVGRQNEVHVPGVCSNYRNSVVVAITSASKRRVLSFVCLFVCLFCKFVWLFNFYLPCKIDSFIKFFCFVTYWYFLFPLYIYTTLPQLSC